MNTSIAANIPPWVAGDPGRLRQVLINLIGNAVKFTPSGEVVVRVNLAEETADEAVVKIEVTDTGIGIAEEHHAKIFEDFTQVDSPLQRKWRGSGLGLSLSKKIAELLGGAVAMASQPGKGSTFSVTIPIRYSGVGDDSSNITNAAGGCHV